MSNLFDSSPRQDVVWAEVAENIENPPSYIVRTRTILNGQNIAGMVIYKSPDLGRRIDAYKEGSLRMRFITAVESRTHTSSDFRLKVCLRDTLGPDSWYNPRKDAHLRKMREFMQRDHVSLGLSEIEGTVVAGIEMVDTLSEPWWQAGSVRTTRIFADVETQLPVLFENRRVNDTIDRYGRAEYEWHPQLTPEDFDPAIPDDFFVADLREPIEIIVERATIGLHNFAQITGRYPKELSFFALRPEVAAELERLKQTGTYSPEIEDSLNTVLYAGVLSRWRDHAPRDFKPHIFDVYESSVVPGDSGKILFRWRMYDKVGVLYGDLRFEITGTEPFEEIDRKRREEYYKRNEELRKTMGVDSLSGPNDPSQ